MSTTVRTIIEQAIGTSLKNRREAIANEPVELILVLRRALTEAFMDATAIFPEYFGTRVDVPFSAPASAWLRPLAALSVYRIELPNGMEVVVVYDRDRNAERFKPSVIERGRQFLPGLSAGSPTSADLTMYYVRAPETIPTGNIDVAIDAGFPDEFTPLLVYALAIYLATKDTRPDEVQRFTAEYENWRTLWRAHLSGATTNSRLRFSPRSSASKAQSQVTPEAT
jgi:hypothetical protein